MELGFICREMPPPVGVRCRIRIHAEFLILSTVSRHPTLEHRSHRLESLADVVASLPFRRQSSEFFWVHETIGPRPSSGHGSAAVA